MSQLLILQKIHVGERDIQGEVNEYLIPVQSDCFRFISVYLLHVLYNGYLISTKVTVNVETRQKFHLTLTDLLTLNLYFRVIFI